MLVYGPDLTPEKLLVDPAAPDHWYVAGHLEQRDTVIETRDAGRSWSTLAIPATTLADGALTFFLISTPSRKAPQRRQRYHQFLLPVPRS